MITEQETHMEHVQGTTAAAPTGNGGGAEARSAAAAASRPGGAAEGRPTARDGPALREPTLAFGATCPECGGSLRINEGDRSLRCQYCHSALYLSAPRGFQSYILPPTVSPGKARLAAIHFIEEKSNGRVRTRHASVADLKLMHVPFWRMRGRLMGWVAGERVTLVKPDVAFEDPRRAETRPEAREEREAYARLVFKRVDWSAPACVLPCLGLQGISLRTSFLEWNVLDEKSRRTNTVALPTRSARNARADAFKYLTHLAVPADTRVRASRFHLFDSTLSLYYYPVYLLRYVFAGRIFTVTIDGGNGSVVRGDVPEERRVNAKHLFFVPATLAFLAATWLPLVLIPIVSLYVLDTMQAKAFLPPHSWLALRIRTMLGSEDSHAR